VPVSSPRSTEVGGTVSANEVPAVTVEVGQRVAAMTGQSWSANATGCGSSSTTGGRRC
jgi:hypothetical protein